MAAGDPVQLGTSNKLGFTGGAPSGLVRDTQTIRPVAEEEVVRGENNAAATIIITNPATEVDISATVLAADYATPLIGATVAAGGVTGRVTKYERREVPLVARVDMTVRKEASLTFS